MLWIFGILWVQKQENHKFSWFEYASVSILILLLIVLLSIYLHNCLGESQKSQKGTKAPLWWLVEKHKKKSHHQILQTKQIFIQGSWKGGCWEGLEITAKILVTSVVREPVKILSCIQLLWKHLGLFKGLPGDILQESTCIISQPLTQ